MGRTLADYDIQSASTLLLALAATMPAGATKATEWAEVLSLCWDAAVRLGHPHGRSAYFGPGWDVAAADVYAQVLLRGTLAT